MADTQAGTLSGGPESAICVQGFDLLRLLLPLDEQVWSSSQSTYPGVAPRVGSNPRTSLIHPIGIPLVDS